MSAVEKQHLPQPAAPPAAAWPHWCGLHPSTPAIARCMRCGRLLCARCRQLDSATQTATCSACAAQAASPNSPRPDASLSPSASASPSAAALRPPQPNRRGTRANTPTASTSAAASLIVEPIPFRRWPQALLRLFVAPSQFFAALRPDVGVWPALRFGLFWSCLAALTGVALHPLLLGRAHPLLTNPQMQAALASSPYAAEVGPITLAISLGLSLLSIGALSVFFLGALYHGILYTLGVRPGTLRPTLKIVAYALAGQSLLLLPGDELPALLARVFTTALLVIGLRQTYQVTFLRAALVIALPMLLNLHVGFDALFFPSQP